MLQDEEHVYTSAGESDFADTSRKDTFPVPFQRKASLRITEFRRALTKPTLYPSEHTVRQKKHTRPASNKDSHVYAKTSKPPKPSIKLNSSEELTSISENLEADSQSHVNTVNRKKLMQPSTLSKANGRKPQQRSVQRNKQHSDNSDSGIVLQQEISDRPMDDSLFPQEEYDFLEIPDQLQHIIKVYQMQLMQKEELLEMREVKIATLENRLRTMEQENGHLRNLVQNTEAKMPVSLEEWKLIQEQAEMVIDVNEALTEQLNHLQNKIRETQVNHKKQEIIIRQSLDACNDEKNIISEELKQLQQRFEFLRDEYNIFRLQENDKMSREEHSLSVQECTRLLGILKDKYEHGINYANTRLKTTQLKSTYQELSDENKVLVTSYRKGLTKLHHLSKSYAKSKMDCLQLKMKLKLVQNQVNEMVIRETALEHNERLAFDKTQNYKNFSYEQKLQQLQRLLAKRHVKLRNLHKLPRNS